MVAIIGIFLYLVAVGAAVGRVGSEGRVTERETYREEVTPRSPASVAEASVETGSSGSVTVPLYRGHSAGYWNWRYRQTSRELRRAQHANHRLRRTLSTSAAPYGTHWLERAFLCIHAGEGPWTIHNPPYDGGLQMDSDFQRTYGDWAFRAFGSAGNWPISVQIAVAIRAYKSGRGFYPWPNTARACGLI